MIQLTPSLSSRLGALSPVLLLCCVIACNDAAAPADTSAVSTTPQGSAPMQPTAAGGSVAVVAAGSGMAKPSQAASAGASAPSSGMAAATGAAGVRAAAAGASAAGVMAAAMSGGAGAAAGGGGAPVAAGSGAAGAAAGSGAAAAGDTESFAMGLHELFLDVPCDSATRAPLEMGATCNHPPMTQRIEKMVKFGGEAGKKYTVKLHVRGVFEPTNIMGGMHASKDVPFTVGGMVAAGAGSSSDSINYQQYFIEVSEPKQTYWLNDYQYVAHDIHKADYEASITVGGGAQLKVVMNDGNEREIANFPKEMFSDIPPYDKMPSLGQLLRLDVVSVEVAP